MTTATVTYPEAIEAIRNANINASQQRAAINLINRIKSDTQSSLTSDVPTYEIEINKSEYGQHASFFCIGEGKIYYTMISAVIGPRGGKNYVRKQFEIK
tara:strand:- start:2253 stop:2549 length:297 start_codon:yes stop_codon:yes gene_type:complete